MRPTGPSYQADQPGSNMDKSREAVSEDVRPTYPSVDAYEFIDAALPKSKVPEAADAMNDIVSWVKTESG